VRPTGAVRPPLRQCAPTAAVRPPLRQRPPTAAVRPHCGSAPPTAAVRPHCGSAPPTAAVRPPLRQCMRRPRNRDDGDSGGPQGDNDSSDGEVWRKAGGHETPPRFSPYAAAK